MTIAAVTCVRDEEDIIEEWIAHHLALGIERIHIFDNFSTDGTRARIETICGKVKGVTVEFWASSASETQTSAFERGLAMMKAEDIEWCAFLDADEFIGSGEGAGAGTFRQFLDRHREHAAIGLNWAIFGSDGIMERPDGLIQELFLRRAEANFDVQRHIKSIVRPKQAKGVHHTHGLSLDAPYYNARGEIIVWRTMVHGTPVHPFAYTENDPSIEGWRVNHYFCRWRRRWIDKVKLSERIGAVWRSEADWQHHDRNEVYDPSALSWAARDRALMEAWNAASLAR